MRFSLLQTNPKLAKEWHSSKNGELTPYDVAPNSHSRAWWVCKKGHEWQARVADRNSGDGCPYCSGRYACKDNCLQTLNPVLAKQWHPTKNKELTPLDVTPGSDKKVWWLCQKGHEWETNVFHRSKGGECPYCSGKAVCNDNCLQTLNPKLAKQWHPNKNYKLTPRDVTLHSNKKIWWICSEDHEWQAQVNSRNSGIGCPYCSGKVACDDNCLQTIKPVLAREWHPTKNGKLTPRDVTTRSGRKVWWLCKKGHEWQAFISNRNRPKGGECPCCSGKVACDDNCLQTLNPALAKQWHPTKNKELTPLDVTPGSHKKVWWICSRGHEWQTTVGDRSNGNNCPYCHSQTSRLELRIFSEMKHLFGKVNHRKKMYGMECDVYIPRLRMGIEIDGEYWHKHKLVGDKQKTNFLKSKNIALLRVRGSGLQKVSDIDISFSRKDSDFTVTSRIVNRILKRENIKKHLENRLKNYLKYGEIANEVEYVDLLERLPSPLPERSLAECNKDLAKQWHLTKNGKLTPWDITPNSNMRIWWICSKGHEWQAMVASRTAGNGCPYCGGKAVCNDNCLQTLNPKLAKQWHPNKNYKLTPRDVTKHSNKKIWWICSEGHEWQTTVNNRSSGNECPYCYRSKQNSSRHSLNHIRA